MVQNAEAKLTHMMDSYDARVVRHLNAEFERRATRGDRVADSVAANVGSWPFIITQSCVLAVWMAWNLVAPQKMRFDPAPFIGLNLLLSFQAGYTAPFIMMSANRMAKRDHLEAEIDYAINFKAEEEVDHVQRELHQIHTQLQELAAENQTLHAKVDELLTRLDRG